MFILCLPVWWFARKHVQWLKWDFCLVIFPYFLWTSLFIIDASEKDFGNVFWEGIFLALTTPLAPIARILTRDRVDARLTAVAGLVVVAAIGVLLWATVPRIGEH